MKKQMLPPPFSQLPERDQRTVEYRANDSVFLQGEKARGVFFVLEGQIELIRHHSNGSSIVLHRAGQSEFFAEASLFSTSYHCDAYTRQPSTIICFDKRAVLRTMRSDIDFSFQVTERFAHQIQMYRRRLELLTIKDATERTFTAISDQMLSGSLKQLAAEIGLTHEAVYRALALLTRQGRVRKIGRGQYQVT